MKITGPEATAFVNIRDAIKTKNADWEIYDILDNAVNKGTIDNVAEIMNEKKETYSEAALDAIRDLQGAKNTKPGKNTIVEKMNLVIEEAIDATGGRRRRRKKTRKPKKARRYTRRR